MQENNEEQELTQEQPEPESAVEETVADQSQDEEIKTESKPDSKNFKALRQQLEKTKQERDESLRREYEYKKAAEAQTQVDSYEEEDDLDISEDDLAEGKHVRKLNKKLNALEKTIKNYEQATSLSNAELKIKAKFPDFEDVVNDNNITLLSNAYPEIAETILSSKNVYKKAVSAYTMIKKLGIESPDFSTERNATESNRNKPKPLASVSPQKGDTPLSHANAFAGGLTDTLKKQLYKEMLEARKNI